MPCRAIGAAVLIAAMLLPFSARAQDGGPGGSDPRKPGARPDRSPKVGAEAPDFTLRTLADPERSVQLSSFEGKKPVCLIFGSYT